MSHMLLDITCPTAPQHEVALSSCYRNRTSPVFGHSEGSDDTVGDDIQHDVRQVRHGVCEAVTVTAIVLCLHNSFIHSFYRCSSIVYRCACTMSQM